MLQKVISMTTNIEVPIDRIRKNIGGYLFVEAIMPLDVLKNRIMDHCEKSGVHFHDPDVPDHEDRRHFSGYGVSGELGFSKQDDYLLVSVMFQKSALADADAAVIQSVKTFWASLCEVSNCVFGYFSQYPEQTVASYRQELIQDIAIYASGDLMDKGFWMSYFNKDFLSLNQSVSEMPSGAWTIGGADHPVTGQSLICATNNS